MREREAKTAQCFQGPHYGCPDRDKDSIPDKLDKCPDDAEDTDGFEDDYSVFTCASTMAETAERLTRDGADHNIHNLPPLIAVTQEDTWL